MVNVDVEVRTLAEGQRAIFTNIHCDKNHILLKISGDIVYQEELIQYSKEEIDDLLQIGRTFFLNCTDLSKFIRHSCNPNCGIRIIGKYAFLLTTRDIKPNEELTIDYSITSTDTPQTWQMNCNCGAWNCRQTISGFALNPVAVKENALNLKIVPEYLK